MSIAESLKGSVITGIYCSNCEFLIEIAMGEATNEDFFEAAAMHHSKIHSGETGDERTNYDIRAVLPPKPVNSINLTLKL